MPHQELHVRDHQQDPIQSLSGKLHMLLQVLLPVWRNLHTPGDQARSARTWMMIVQSDVPERPASQGEQLTNRLQPRGSGKAACEIPAGLVPAQQRIVLPRLQFYGLLPRGRT